MSVKEARVPILHDNRAPPAHITAESVGSSAPTPHVLVSLCAGAAAGAVAKTTIAPLDRTKINFQISHAPYSWKAAFSFLSSSLRTEGVRSLWRGNSATMARIVPYAGVQFAAHEQWKKLLGVNTQGTAREHPLLLLMAGSLAGVTSQSATYPLDVARARMAVAKGSEYRTILGVLTTVTKEEGARTLYRGYLPTILGVIPYAGVSFFTYDTLKRKYKERWGRSPKGFQNIIVGGAAGAVAQTASYPLDVIRRRMQTCRRKPDLTYPYPDITTTVKTIYKIEGWKGFFKGLSMNWVKGPLAVGVSFATYDAIKYRVNDLMTAAR